MGDEEVIDKAIAMYRRHCEQNGLTAPEPARASTEVTQRRVRLFNVNGKLAEFERKPEGKLVLIPSE